MKRYNYLFVILSILLFAGLSHAEFLVRTVSTTMDGNTYTLETLDILEGDFLMNMGCRLDTGAVDIVFAIDSTGSMSGELSDVRATIGDFADAMEAGGYDYAFGGITFGDGENVWDFDLGTPDVYDLTTDITEFEAKLAGVGASGGGDGPETSMDAIYNAATMYNWRPYAIHIIIMFTDIRFCTLDYASASGCCCDDATEVYISDVFDAVTVGGNICYNIYGTSYGTFDVTAAAVFDSMSSITGGASYVMGIGFESIFAEVLSHLGEYASIYIDLENTGSSTVDSLIAVLDPGGCLTPMSSVTKIVRNIDPGERVFLGWPIDIDSLCIGGERCFNVYLTGSDGYADTIFGCTTTEDCHCIAPAVTVALPTPTGRISACEDQAILFHCEAAFGVELDNTTAEVVVNGVTYTDDDPEVSVAAPFVSFNPSEMWEHGDTVLFSLAALADLNGCPIDEPVRSHFYVDLEPPMAAVAEPAEGDTFFTDVFSVELTVDDDIAGIDFEASFLTINGDTMLLDDEFVTYTGDSSAINITITGNGVLDFGFSPMDTAEICFHGADLVISEYCGPNEGVQCFSWPVMLLTREVWFGEMQAAPCETILVPVYIDTIQVSQIENISFDIHFNPEVLQPINVVYDGSIIEGWTGTYVIDPMAGTISADLSGTRLEAGLSGILLYIRAVVPCTAGGGDFTNLNIDDFVFNSGFPMCDNYDGFFISTWRVQTWLMDIIVNKTEGRVLDQNLAIGASMHTTDNYEPGSDLPILPPTPDHVNAYLSLNDAAYPFITALRRDMRGMEPPVRWVVKTVGEGEPMDLIEGYAHWDPSRLPEGNFIMNEVLDMKSDTMVVFYLGDSLIIEWVMPDLASSEIPMACAGWNMISLPTVPPSYPPSEVFPHSPVGIFEFDTQRRTYIEAERFTAGYGYWLYSPVDTTAIIAGVELMNYSMSLYPGWNLIGAVSSPVAVDDICTSEEGVIFGPIYYYNCETGGYDEATDLEPGKGYWLFAAIEAVLSVPSGSSMYCRPFESPADPEWMGNIKVNGSPFIFGYSDRAKTGIDNMDIVMPPASPDGITEAAIIRDGFNMRQDISSALQWTAMIPEGSDLEFTLPAAVNMLKIEGPEGFDADVYNGMKLDGLKGGIYRIAASSVPAKFEIIGAYPNPFNAAVEISFITPEAGEVKMDVYDITGHKVTTLLDEEVSAGKNTVRWSASGEPSGLYFYRIDNGDKVISGTISLIK